MNIGGGKAAVPGAKKCHVQKQYIPILNFIQLLTKIMPDSSYFVLQLVP